MVRLHLQRRHHHRLLCAAPLALRTVCRCDFPTTPSHPQTNDPHGPPASCWHPRLWPFSSACLTGPLFDAVRTLMGGQRGPAPYCALRALGHGPPASCYPPAVSHLHLASVPLWWVFSSVFPRLGASACAPPRVVSPFVFLRALRGQVRSHLAHHPPNNLPTADYVL